MSQILVCGVKTPFLIGSESFCDAVRGALAIIYASHFYRANSDLTLPTKIAQRTSWRLLLPRKQTTLLICSESAMKGDKSVAAFIIYWSVYSTCRRNSQDDFLAQATALRSQAEFAQEIEMDASFYECLQSHWAVFRLGYCPKIFKIHEATAR